MFDLAQVYDSKRGLDGHLGGGTFSGGSDTFTVLVPIQLLSFTTLAFSR